MEVEIIIYTVIMIIAIISIWKLFEFIKDRKNNKDTYNLKDYKFEQDNQNIYYNTDYNNTYNESKNYNNIYQQDTPVYYRNDYPYKRKYLLTKNEFYFYKRLRPIAEKYNLNILTKIRIADLVDVDTTKTNEYYKYFAKIKAKHIDFALVNINMEVIYLIELDDYTHSYKNRIERDNFVNQLLLETGYKLIRTYGDVNQINTLLYNTMNNLKNTVN